MALGIALDPSAAVAIDTVTYNAQAGSDLFKTLAGVGYVALIIVYFARLLKRRADTATTERLATTSTRNATESDEEEEDSITVSSVSTTERDVTPTQCFV